MNNNSKLKKKRITQREIAQQAGASASLVSRVLSNRVQYISVSEEKIRRIKRIAADFGY
jgi:DNA-binding LacI/PurR family transcriptional regulator